MKKVNGLFAYRRDMGKVRINNEDQAIACTNRFGQVLLLVCDGMGGESHGDIASNMAVTMIKDAFLNRKFKRFDLIFVNHALRAANNAIYEEALHNPSLKGMGTTATLVLLSGKFMTIGHIGDTRIYSQKEKELAQITEDQTYVNYLYRSGQIKKEEMDTHPRRHVLTNALGIYPSLNLDQRTFIYDGKPLLLCSDGLYNNVSHEDMFSIVRSDETPDQKVDSLISLANENGGSDNIAVVYWENKNVG